MALRNRIPTPEEWVWRRLLRKPVMSSNDLHDLWSRDRDMPASHAILDDTLNGLIAKGIVGVTNGKFWLRDTARPNG